MQKEEFQWLSLKIVFVIIAVFILQNAFPQLTGTFALKRDFLLQPWTLLTYIFLHGSFTHLFSNVFSLFIFGSILEKVVGYRNFLKVFFFIGILSGAFGIFFYNSVIGASGSVFGVIGVLGILRPKMTVWALGVPMYMIATIIVYAVMDLAGAFFPSDVAHIGHISAMVIGIIIGLFWRKKYSIPKSSRENKIVISEEEFRRWEEEYVIPKKKISQPY